MSPLDLLALTRRLREQLTAPGAEFEIRVEDVRGLALEVFANRRHNLGDWLLHSHHYGDRECLVQGERRISFAEHAELVGGIAEHLRTTYGIEPGDRVAIFAANSADWLIAFWAATALGAVVVAANAWWSAREAAQAFADAQPKVVIADGKRAGLVENDPVLAVEEFVIIAANSLAQIAVRKEDDPAVIMYTSGTTGRAKGATHSQRNLLAVIEWHRLNDAIAAAVAEATGQPARTEPRRFLMSLPLFHIASLHNLALPRLATGDAVVIDSGRFDADRVLRLVERERITNWALVPTMAHRVANQAARGSYDLSTLAALSVNSAPSSPELKDRVRAALPTVQAALADSYGLTEASTAATVAGPAELAAYPDTVGSPIATVAVDIRDPAGERCAEGVEGEVWLRSQFVMLGYWRDPDATAAAITPDGWLRTGDIGLLRDGRLYLASRRSDLILRGGENVYPAEVEAVLSEHPGVAECAVYGREHGDLGQEVVAVIVTTSALTDTELAAYLRDRLAHYKVPSRWLITAEPLTRTATGKVVRTALPR